MTYSPDPHPTTSPSERPTLVTLTGIGILGGVLSGLFAIGGGILMVPLLVSRARMNQRVASATSLLAIIPTAVVGSITYLLNGEIDLVAGSFIAVGAIVGAIIGSALLKRIPLRWLRWMFIVFILAVAVRLLLVTPERGHHVSLDVAVAAGYVALGLAMGISSGLFGIGGGIIAVPLMVSLFAIGDLVAKGTSLLVTIPTSAVGSAANRKGGIVDVRASLIVGIAAAASAIPAVALAVRIPARTSGILFAALLFAVAIQLSVKASRRPPVAAPNPAVAHVPSSGGRATHQRMPTGGVVLPVGASPGLLSSNRR